MQYIVLDLEWNQPISYNSAAYKSVGGKLLFELIQIGAVKVDEKMQVVDSFSQLICPQQYLKLHPRISRITHITQEDLMGAPEFNEAVAAFAAWCGEDYALLTWGCDDVSVLDQNMTFFQCETKLGKVYDIQQLFGRVIGNSKERKGLKSAMDYYEIVPDEEAARVVQDIFAWKLMGLSANSIAQKHNERGTLSPAEYKKASGARYKTSFQRNPEAKGTPKAVLRILSNEIYIGVLEQGKREKVSYKVKKTIRHYTSFDLRLFTYYYSFVNICAICGQITIL